MSGRAYFEEDTIDRVAGRMLEEAGRFGRYHPLELRQGDFALLIVDMQRHYLDPGSRAFIPSAVPIIGRIAALARKASESGAPVIATRHTNTPDDAGMMRAWWPSLLGPDDPGSEVIPEVLEVSDIVVEKSRYDAFRGTRLLELLEDSSVSQVVITGVMTNLCCESTARAAFDLGFECFLVLDATAAYTEELHRASVLNLSYGFAVPVLASGTTRAMEGRRPER